ncbi:MAG: MMPL family transporter [Micrococcales bacterium]|nr:MMPL family transporter [Micrococcales bacterium]
MRALSRALAAVVSGRRSAWVVLIGCLVAVGAVFALSPQPATDGVPTTGLPASAESQRVADLSDAFPGTPTVPAVLVWSTDRSVALTASEQRAVASRAASLAALGSGAPVRPLPSTNERSMVATVLMDADSVTADSGKVADALRTAASEGLPAGIQTRLTGPVGFTADTVNAFAGTDIRLLLITASVVALLLILTYRSPVLWIVPLVVIGAADGLARVVAGNLAAAAGIEVSAQVSGILSVLVFGAGTDYALLLVSRYRDELRRTPDRHVAMAAAVRGAGPAIAASALTVTLALCALLLAEISGTRALGFACAIGVVLAFLFAIIMLPAALVVFGRGLFWPLVPRVGDADSTTRGLWARVGRGVRRRPVLVAVAAVVLLGALGTGLVGARVGISQTEQLLGTPSSVQAQGILDRDFGRGYGNTAVMLVPDEFARDSSIGAPNTLAMMVDGVQSATPTVSHDGRTQVLLRLNADPQSEDAFRIIRDLRASLASPDSDAPGTLVGGPDATALDVQEATRRDELVIIPIIGVIVLLVLLALLRSVVAPLLLLATVVGTLLAALGLASVIFLTLGGQSGFAAPVPLYAFLFLVALGVDYNIFLSTRAREEAAVVGVRDGMRRALAATGGVITSAGLVLAAVFVVLAVLPVVALLQVGVIVCIGVLLDTLVVRTLLVPALAFLSGRAFFWPSRLRS